MRAILLGLGFALLASAAGKGKCTADIPVQWQIQGTYVDGSTPDAILGDGSAYINGQDGVESVVSLCDGTGDAKLVLNFSTRNLTISFANALSTNGDTPSFAQGGQTIGCMNICWLLNVRNIWYVPAGHNHAEEYDFTTQLAGGGPLHSHVEMLNPNAQAVPPAGVAAANDPYPDSLVNVHHCPASLPEASALCAAGQPERWLVSPDANPTQPGISQTGHAIIQVASLILDGTRGKGPVNGGEFSIPFYFVITARQ